MGEQAQEGNRISLDCSTSITEGPLWGMMQALSQPQMCSLFLRQPCSWIPTSRFGRDGARGRGVSRCVVRTRTCWNGRLWIKHACSFCCTPPCWYAPLPQCLCTCTRAVVRVCACVCVSQCVSWPGMSHISMGPFARVRCWVALIFNPGTPHLLSLAGDTLLCHSLPGLPRFHQIVLPPLSLLLALHSLSLWLPLHGHPFLSFSFFSSLPVSSSLSCAWLFFPQRRHKTQAPVEGFWDIFPALEACDVRSDAGFMWLYQRQKEWQAGE